MSRAGGAHPVVILLALTVGGILAGITGAFLAVPLVAVVNAVHRYHREWSRDERQPALYPDPNATDVALR